MTEPSGETINSAAGQIEHVSSAEEVDAVFVYNKDWRSLANCINEDPELFYPIDIDGIKAAKAICAKCVVSTSCLEFALRFPNIANSTDTGDVIWGGTTVSERQLLRDNRR